MPKPAGPLEAEPPMRRVGLRKTASSGTPLGVSKAMLRLSASVVACLSRASTWALLVSLTRLFMGPVNKS